MIDTLWNREPYLTIDTYERHVFDSPPSGVSGFIGDGDIKIDGHLAVNARTLSKYNECTVLDLPHAKL